MNTTAHQIKEIQSLENDEQRLRFSIASGGWFVLALLSAWLVVPALFQFRGLLLEYELRLGFYLLVWLVWWRVNGIAILLVAQVYLFFIEGPNRQSAVELWWLPCLLLVLISAADRVRVTRRLKGMLRSDSVRKNPSVRFWRVWVWLPRAINGTFSRIRDVLSFAGLTDELRTAVREWVGLLLGVLFCVGVAWLLLWLVPLDTLSRQKIRLLPTGYRAISFTILLGLLAIGVSTFVSGWTWRRMSSSQARIYVRTSLANWIEPELRGAIKRQQKISRRSDQSQEKGG